jgi:hypothetical protein
MLLVWTIFFTMIHEEEERILGSIITENVVDVITDEVQNLGDDEF